MIGLRPVVLPRPINDPEPGDMILVSLVVLDWYWFWLKNPSTIDWACLISGEVAEFLQKDSDWFRSKRGLRKLVLKVSIWRVRVVWFGFWFCFFTNRELRAYVPSCLDFSWALRTSFEAATIFKSFERSIHKIGRLVDEGLWRS